MNNASNPAWLGLLDLALAQPKDRKLSASQRRGLEIEAYVEAHLENCGWDFAKLAAQAQRDGCFPASARPITVQDALRRAGERIALRA